MQVQEQIAIVTGGASGLGEATARALAAAGAKVAVLDRQIDKAKAVCGRCSVTEMCLQYALDTSQDSGVWGGLSEDERRALKRRAARARRAS